MSILRSSHGRSAEGSEQAPAAPAKSDEKPAIWAADAKRKIPLYDRAQHRQNRAVHRSAVHRQADSLANFATELQPRGINIYPNAQYLVASGEKSDRLSLYRIDQASGKLGDPTRYPVRKGANWIEIVEA